jgi:hypothetical protein
VIGVTCCRYVPFGVATEVRLKPQAASDASDVLCVAYSR